MVYVPEGCGDDDGGMGTAVIRYSEQVTSLAAMLLFLWELQSFSFLFVLRLLYSVRLALHSVVAIYQVYPCFVVL